MEEKKPFLIATIVFIVIVVILVTTLYFFTRNNDTALRIFNSSNSNPTPTQVDFKLTTPTEIPSIKEFTTRDGKRKDLLERIELARQEYFDNNAKHATQIEFQTEEPYSIIIGQEITVDTESETRPGTESSSEFTKYHFQYLGENEYELGVCLELEHKFYNSFGAKEAGISC